MHTKTFVAITSVGAAVLTGALALVLVGAGGGIAPPFAGNAKTSSATGSPAPTPGSTAASHDPAALADAFFSDWVHDGRVIRRDQGSDTVSEGQAYGMLIAAGRRDEKQFASIWAWTKNHLMRPDGLLAWRWSKGSVVDDQPASDADVDTARALLVAGDAMHRPSWMAAGKALAAQIADRMTATTAAGRILLPGLWAAGSEPYAYNPSYASPAAFAVIGRFTGDARWNELATGTRAVTDALLAKSPLPPDWAQVHADGTVDAMPGARGSGEGVRYGYDAARLPLRFAESCTPGDRATAARLAATLDRDRPLRAELDLGGTAITTDSHPIAYLGRAAARSAADDSGHAGTDPRPDAKAIADIRSADRLAAAEPTYYGAAWAALAPISLGSKALGGCPPLAGADANAKANTDANAKANTVGNTDANAKGGS